MKILFLDIDGVMNSQLYFDQLKERKPIFEKCRQLGNSSLFEIEYALAMCDSKAVVLLNTTKKLPQ